MSCVNPRIVLLARLFTLLDYQFEFKGSGSPIVEPPVNCPLTSKLDSKSGRQLLAASRL